MRESGTDMPQALRLLGHICITPVFTAHPTEVARRSVMFKRRRISDLLERLDRIPIPAAELESLEADLLAEITALWQTDDVRSARPTVQDEIRMALDYFESSLFDTLPVLYAEVQHAFAAEFYESAASIPALADLPLLVSFGSWIGGDRDGNPFVTPATTTEALAMSRDLLNAHYLRRLQNVFDQLGTSTQQVPVSDELRDKLASYLDALKSTGPNSPDLRVVDRFTHEYVRLFVACIMIRLGGSAQSSATANRVLPDAARPLPRAVPGPGGEGAAGPAGAANADWLLGRFDDSSSGRLAFSRSSGRCCKQADTRTETRAGREGHRA
jgi:phosphoenolpyruvate carboxylase